MGTLAHIEPCILLADDEPDLLNLMTFKLKKEGYNVQISANGDHIFEMVHNDPPDIILLDIAMSGGIDGGDICRQLKSNEESCHIPILMFSANDNIAEITKECGADDFISKPINTAILKEKIDALLHKDTDAA